MRILREGSSLQQGAAQLGAYPCTVVGLPVVQALLLTRLAVRVASRRKRGHIGAALVLLDPRLPETQSGQRDAHSALLRDCELCKRLTALSAGVHLTESKLTPRAPYDRR